MNLEKCQICVCEFLKKTHLCNDPINSLLTQKANMFLLLLGQFSRVYLASRMLKVKVVILFLWLLISQKLHNICGWKPSLWCPNACIKIVNFKDFFFFIVLRLFTDPFLSNTCLLRFITYYSIPIVTVFYSIPIVTVVIVCIPALFPL